MAVKQNTKINGSTIAIIILSVLALITRGYIIYSKIIENNTIANNNSIDLNVRKTTDKIEVTTPTDAAAETEISTDYLGNGYIFSQKLESQGEFRYQLVVVSGGERSAYNDISSEDDTYYLLDMSKLGQGDDLRKFDLVSIMKPFTDDAIKNRMPASSTDAVGGVTNLSACKSFSIEYYSPSSSVANIPFDGSKEIPISVDYYCKTDTYSTLFKKIVYRVDAETGTVSEL